MDNYYLIAQIYDGNGLIDTPDKFNSQNFTSDISFCTTKDKFCISIKIFNENKLTKLNYLDQSCFNAYFIL